MKPEDFIMVPIPASQYVAVCALLSGAAVGALTVQHTGKSNPAPASTVAAPTPAAEPSTESAGAEASPAATGDAGAANDGELDAAGWPWSPELHASTKGKTKDGLWRMKVGVSRPDPKPGFPKEGGNSGQSADTGTSSATDTPSATSQTAAQGTSTSAPAVTSTPDAGEDDEFAAFRAAAATSAATDAAAAASAPTTRQFSDADLGALCNQAAVKLGDPGPIKEIIARFVPEGQVAHSRNIPAERRDEFAKEVEAKAGIEFAG